LPVVPPAPEELNVMGTHQSAQPQVHGTKAVAAALGVCVGLSGLDHGLFETLQGNTPTPGIIVQAIGPAQRMWVYGTEEAFTIVPNFLATGLLAMFVGLLTILWSLRYLDRPNGALVLLGLGGLMFLVGGGIGMLVFLLAGWLVARRIHRPPTRLPSRLPRTVRGALERSWPAFVVAGLALYAFALEVAIVGFVPGVSDPDQARSICWLALLGMLAAMVIALLGASVAPSDETQGHHGARATVAGLR
jgi:peptidoglycan/LPS O-acetylase OafA/YrhL